MERLTYDFCIGGNHCWQVKGADNLEFREVCERQGDDGCKTCPIAKAFDRLAAIEDILGDEYDLADVAPVRHGSWMTTDAYPHHLYCSVCYKTYAKNAKWVDELDLPTNYCPNCGARMDKEADHD